MASLLDNPVAWCWGEMSAGKEAAWAHDNLKMPSLQVPTLIPFLFEYSCYLERAG